MKIIALSGGIAAGKNHVAEIFADFGGAVFDADKVNHEILLRPEIIQKIAEIFPKAVENGKINRQKLGKIVFSDKEDLAKLEKITHFEIRKKYQEFLQDAQDKKAKFLVLNIPLLLEKAGYEYDYLVAIIADNNLRKKRYIEREMNKNANLNKQILEQKFDDIAAHQALDEKRIEKADFVIKNNGDVKSDVQKILDHILK
jgi:dephospho-CoA kinase